MGWISDAWDSTKDAVSSAWDSTKDAVKDVTGIESMNDLLFPGFGVASGMAALQGRGAIGEFLNPMLQPPGGTGPGAPTGPLNQPAPASLTMGAGGGAAPTQRSSPQSLASYFGNDGYAFGPTETSAALLKANPDAYKFAPLTSSLS